MILLSHLKTGISASEYAKRFIRTATGERECVRRVKSAAGGGRKPRHPVARYPTSLWGARLLIGSVVVSDHDKVLHAVF